MLQITESKNGLLLKVKAQPGASRSEIVGEYDGGLKIRLAAPPVDGKANAACVTFLAETLGLPKNAVELVKGETSTIKILRIQGIEKSTLLCKLSDNNGV